MLNFIILYMNGRKNISRLLFHWKDQYIPVGKQQKSRKNPLQRRRLRRQVQSLGQEDPLEEEMATHSSILAWRIPWTE